MNELRVLRICTRVLLANNAGKVEYEVFLIGEAEDKRRRGARDSRAGVLDKIYRGIVAGFPSCGVASGWICIRRDVVECAVPRVGNGQASNRD